MATTPPLHGLRIIECSALGPAAITTALVDLGADVIKVEPPAGDYIREMTWPIVEGTSLMHLHLNRGKRSLVLDLRTDAGVAILKELATGRRRRGGGHAAGCAGPARCRLRRPAASLNPKIVFCSISGYGMTGPYRDYPSHGVAYDTWAGIVNVATDDEGFTYIPEHVSIGINAGPLFGALGILAAVIRARATGESSFIDLAQSDAAAAMDWYRSESFRAYERPQSEVTGNKSDNYERRAPGTAGMVEGVRYQVYEAADGRYVLFMASEQAFWKNFCEAVDRMDLFERWPGSKYADHARGNRELQHELRDIFRTKTAAGVARVRRPGQHAHRAGELAQDPARRPPVRRPLPAPAGIGGGGGPTLHAAALRRRGAATTRPRPPRWGSTPRRSCARCWVMTTIRSPPPGTGAHSGPTT